MRVKTVLLVCLIWSGADGLPAQELLSSTSPQSRPDIMAELPEKETRAYPFHQFVTLGAIRAYQMFVSPAKGPSCPMHPHCSLYGYLSFQTHHPVKAFLMTSDRLYRCGHDLDNYEPALENGQLKFFDPPGPAFSRFSLQSESVIPEGYLPQMQIPTVCAELVENDTENEDTRLFRFAQMLQLEGDYERAITEYRRLLFYFPGSAYRRHAQNAIFYCYYDLAEYVEAIAWGESLLKEEAVESSDKAAMIFYLGSSCFKREDFSAARTYLAEVSTFESDGQFTQKALILQGLSYVKEADWENAERTFARVSPDSMFAGYAQHCQDLARQGPLLTMKNPDLAGILAIVPGMGYLYSGYEGTALSALLVNALFIGGTVEAFHRDHHVLGATLALVSAGWYAGNIYGSVVSAERKNVQTQQEFQLQFQIGFSF